MEIIPILAALRRHRTAAILVAVEIALSCAILCNAIFMISDRLSNIHLISGLDEHELSYIHIGGAYPNGKSASIAQEHLAALRSIQGVTDVVAVNSMPFSKNEWDFTVSLKPDDPIGIVNTDQFYGTDGVVRTMGLKLIAGRDFTADDDGDLSPEYLSTSPVSIIPQALAQKVWPDGQALGKQFYLGSRPYTVVGIVAHLAGAGIKTSATADYSILFPVRAGEVGSQYLLRSAPADRERVLREAAKALQQISPTAIIMEQTTFDQIRDEFFQQDRAMAGLLVGVCVLLLVVTALGIVGLASFWVQGRRRQIGIRRALGARRIDILRYFQIENFVIVSAGILLGMLCAYGLNFGLMRSYELPRLPFYYLPISALSLWTLGQLAVLGPALRAARVPPVVATRSV